jgi:hypothetical protein
MLPRRPVPQRIGEACAAFAVGARQALGLVAAGVSEFDVLLAPSREAGAQLGAEERMEQRCHLAAVWLTWLGIPLLAIVIGLRAGLSGAIVVLAAGVAAQLIYLRGFPRISRYLPRRAGPT